MPSVEIKLGNLRNNLVRNNNFNRLNVLVENLSCIYFNSTSLDNKMDGFKALCDIKKPDIVGITETWFKPDSLPEVNGFNLYRKDRGDGRRGGGVVIYINNQFSSYELSNDPIFNTSKLEQIWAILNVGAD
jgi:hypothetical protein